MTELPLNQTNANHTVQSTRLVLANVRTSTGSSDRGGVNLSLYNQRHMRRMSAKGRRGLDNDDRRERIVDLYAKANRPNSLDTSPARTLRGKDLGFLKSSDSDMVPKSLCLPNDRFDVPKMDWRLCSPSCTANAVHSWCKLTDASRRRSLVSELARASFGQCHVRGARHYT